MSNDRASITIDTEVTGAEESGRKLDTLKDKATGVGTATEQGANKAEKGLTRYRNALVNTIAAAKAMGDPVNTQLIKASINDKDLSSLNHLVVEARAAYDAEQQRKLATKQAADAVAQATKQQDAFTSALDKSIAKTQALISAQQGATNTQANQIANLAKQQGVALNAGNSAKVGQLSALENQLAQQKAANAQTLASVRQVASQEKSIADQIQRLTASFATSGMSAADSMVYKIQQQGLSLAKFQPAIDQLRQVEQASKTATQATAQVGQQMMANGMTVKAYQAALRGVPAQMTDIVVSLQGGQRPLTVLLQQGGQLKDMFGGVKEAAVAVGGYLKQMFMSLMSFVTPVTAGIAAVVAILGTLAAAAKTANDEFIEFDNALARAGNIAGGDASALMGLKDNITSITGSSKAAGEAVTALAKDGRLSFDEMSDSAKLLANMMIATGKSAEELAPKIENIYAKPSEAAVELNKDIRFLSEEVYNSAKAFEKQGRFAEASALIMREVGSSSEDVSRRVQSNAQAMATAWQGVKEAIVSAWRALVAFYTESKAQKINSAFDDQEAQLGAIGHLDSSAMDDLDRRRKKALSDVKANTKEVEKQLDFERRIARGKYGQEKAKKTKKSGSGSRTTPEQSSYQSLSQSITEKTDAVKQELLYGSKLTETDKLIIKINAEQANGKKKLTDAHKDELLQRANTLKQLEKELEVKKFMQKFDENFAKDKEKLVNKYGDEIAVLGMGTEEAKAYKEAIDIARKGEEQYQEALNKGATAEQLQHIKDATQDLIKTNEDLRQQYQRGFNNPFLALTESIKNYNEEAQNTGKQMRNAFDNAFKSMEDAFVQFVTTGKLSFKDLVNSILADMARMAAQKAVSGFLDGIMQIGARAIAGWMGGSSTTTTTTTASAYPTNSDVRVGYQHRAVGGPVNSGSPYIIGEKGPELFIPSQSGKVIPNNQLGGAIGAGGFNIQISHRNEGTQQQVTSSGADFDGKNLIIKIVTQDIANDGMISRTMSKTFGMRRAAGAM